MFESQIALAYTPSVTNPPGTYEELVTWIKAHPGKFGYNGITNGMSGVGFKIPLFVPFVVVGHAFRIVLRALDRVSLTLPVGSLTAVLGPSGCGKTTLMRCLAGFGQPDSGQVLFGGQDVTRLPAQDRGTAMVFQNYALWPHMTVFDNIAYGLKLRKVPPAGAGAASVVFRAADVHLVQDQAVPAGAVLLPGTVDEVLYLGTVYRHYVRVGGDTVMVDAPEPQSPGPVELAVPVRALQVFAAESAAS